VCSLVEVGFRGLLVLLDGFPETRLLQAPLRRETIVRRDTDAPIKLVHIYGIEASLEIAVLFLEPRDRRLVELTLVATAQLQGSHDPFKDVRVKFQVAEDGCKLLFQHFFPDEWFAALATIAGAVIIHIPSLLQFGGQAAPTVAAREQAGEGKRTMGPPVLASSPQQDVLDTRE
jgi:hypothetical protein